MITKIPMLFWISIQPIDNIENCFDWWEHLPPDVRYGDFGNELYEALQARIAAIAGDRLHLYVPLNN